MRRRAQAESRAAAFEAQRHRAPHKVALRDNQASPGRAACKGARAGPRRAALGAGQGYTSGAHHWESLVQAVRDKAPARPVLGSRALGSPVLANHSWARARLRAAASTTQTDTWELDRFAAWLGPEACRARARHRNRGHMGCAGDDLIQP